MAINHCPATNDDATARFVNNIDTGNILDASNIEAVVHRTRGTDNYF